MGWWTIVDGHVLLIAASLPAALLGGAARDFVMAAQDVGFLGAMLAALGGIPLGISGLRGRTLPRGAALLFVAALPVGLVGIAVLVSAGVPEDYHGLPLTVLYGGAWVTLATHWLRSQRPATVRAV